MTLKEMTIYFHRKFCYEQQKMNFNKNLDSISTNRFINLFCNRCEMDIDLIFVK